MQMLQQFLGEQGARYAFYALTFVALLVAVLVIWVLIRKALGDRLNFSDKPDRRGRAPRLGITESFSVDRQGRRLVMVRRDNVEHLVMIGGPNDVVIETNVVRGERPVVSRSEQRTAEPELIPALALQAPEPAPVPAPPAPVPARPLPPSQPLPAAPRPVPPPIAVPAMKSPEISAPEVKAPEVKAPEFRTPVSASPIPAPPAPTPSTPASPAIAPPDAKSIAEKAKELAKAMAPVAAADSAPSEKPAVKPAMSFAERVKSSLPFGGGAKAEKAAAVEKPAEVAKPEIPAVELPKAAEMKTVAPPAETMPKLGSEADIRAKIDDVLRVKETVRPAVLEAPPPVFRNIPPPPVLAPVITPAASAPPAPAAPKAPPPPVEPSAPVPAAAPAPVTAAPSPAKSTSKNPFDSLEEEMAKLLGRAPDGKG
jgi:flagellar protein FliO/FliZ